MSTSKKTAILGSGNIGMSLAKGLVKSDYCLPGDITLTRRNVQHLSTQQQQGLLALLTCQQQSVSA